MDEQILKLTYSLANSINDLEIVKRLNELESKLNGSYEVYLLTNKKDECLEKYNRLSAIYKEDSEELKSALKELKEAKENLNNHILIKEYLSVYSQVRDLYMEIDHILFSEYRGSNC